MITLYATSITGLAFVSRAMANSMPAESSVVALRPTYLETLRQAGSFDSSAVGIAGTKSATYQAFEQALAQLRSDQVMVIHYSGCERITLSMAQVVAEISHEQGLELSIE